MTMISQFNSVSYPESFVVSAGESGDGEPDFGGPFTGDKVRVVDRFSETDVNDLFNGRILAFVCRDYLTRIICDYAAARILENARMEGYEVEKNVDRHGVSFYDVAKNPELAARYFEDSVPAMRDLGSIFEPFGSVIDRLQAELDMVWRAGAKIMCFSHDGLLRKLKRGTARKFARSHKIDAHCDVFRFDAAGFPNAPKIQRQISLNVYLRVPPNGGELVLFPRRIRTAAEEAQLRDPSSRYGLREELLGTPVEVRPQQGDLVAFLADRGHSVRPSVGGDRITASVFAGYVDDESALPLFN